MVHKRLSKFVVLFMVCAFPLSVLAQHVWISGDNAAHKVDYNGQVTDTISALPADPYRIAQHGDGDAWATYGSGSNMITRLLASGTVDCHYTGGGSSRYYGVAVAGDGSVWVTDDVLDQIEHISTTCVSLGAYSVQDRPRDLVITPDNKIYVVHYGSSSLMSQVTFGGTVEADYPVCTQAISMAVSTGPGGILDNRLHLFCYSGRYINTYDRSGSLLDSFTTDAIDYVRGLQSNPRLGNAIGYKEYQAPSSVEYHLREQDGTVLCDQTLTGSGQSYGVTYGLDGANWVSAGNVFYRFYDPFDPCPTPVSIQLGATVSGSGNYGDPSGYQWFIGPGAALDTDGDGLNNYDEITQLLTFPNSADSDSDGSDDDMELSLGSNPISDQITPGAVKIGSDLRVSYAPNNGFRPSLSWNGSEFGVSWQDFQDANYEIYFSRVSSQGDTIDPNLRITYASSHGTYPDLLWTGSEYGLGWHDQRYGNREIFFTRLSESGAMIGGEMRVTSNAPQSQVVDMAWTGSEYGLAWQDMLPGNFEIYFTRVSASGSTIGTNLRITHDSAESAFLSLAWTGSEYGIAWQDERDGLFEIYFNRITEDGSTIGSDLRLTYNSDGERASLAWTGSEFGVCWNDLRSGNWEIYFTRVAADGSTIILFEYRY